MNRMREATAEYGARAPKSMCGCGHTGDGANSEHDAGTGGFAPGHGACTVAGCACQWFSWAGWTLPFQALLAKAKAAP